MSSTDFTLEVLLDMDGEIYFYPSKHWHRIQVRKLKYVDRNFPRGIKYSLTLHSPNGSRILGYDNAHVIPGDKFDVPFDHIHKGARVVKYNYQSATQLLADFSNDVDIILEFEREYGYEI